MTDIKQDNVENCLKDILIELEPSYNKNLNESKLTKAWLTPEKMENDLESLLNKNMMHVYGFETYLVCKILKIRITDFCKFAFPLYFTKLKIKSDPDQHSSHENQPPEFSFINQFVVSQDDIAESADIEPDRLNEIVNGDINGFYAFEIVSIVVSQKISLISTFNYLYQNRYNEILLTIPVPHTDKFKRIVWEV